MLYHNNYKQTGGWCCDWPFPIPNYDCCGEIIKFFNPCDVISDTISFIVNIIIVTPINLIIRTLNTVNILLNNIISILLKLIYKTFNFILELIKQPIIITNRITSEFRTIISLIIDVLGGDILSIILVFILPYIIYFKNIITVIIQAIKLPIGGLINSIISIIGIDPIIPQDVSLYHILLITKYVLIMVYLHSMYGFLQLVF